MDWDRIIAVATLFGVIMTALINAWPALRRARGEVKAATADAAESLSNASASLVEQYRKEVAELRAKVEGLERSLEVEKLARQQDNTNSALIIHSLSLQLTQANARITELTEQNKVFQGQIVELRQQASGPAGGDMQVKGG